MKQYIPVSLKDTIKTILILLAAWSICMILQLIDQSDAYVSMIFLLAVFFISRYTNGYLYGTVSSFLSVLAVNFFFSYPQFKFNFTISGYPITIFSMLTVAIITSALITQVKQQSVTKIEVEKEKTRSNLLRAVSHDLRTPLTSILGASSAILENDGRISSKERLKLVSEIKEESQWLIRMVENLLSVTRIEGGQRAEIKKQEEAAEEVASEAVQKFKKRFPEQEVHVSVPPELLLIPMDAMLIEQVLINLLENAVIHTPRPVSIQLIIKKTGDEAVFTVYDNGVGIDQEVLPYIFSGQFCTLREEDSDTRRNMGIGLSVCNTIIQAHGGTMKAENRLSEGAAVSFTLPMKEENHVA